MKERQLFCILIGFFLTLLAGLRAGITSDYDAYLDKYNIFKAGYIDEGMEVSYKIICDFIANTIDHFNGVLLIYAFLAIVPLVYAAIIQTRSSLLIFPYFYSYYFFLHPMTQIREAVAASMLLVSLQFIKERKLTFFIISIIIGSFFHVSLMLFLPFYIILTRVKLTFKTSIICFIICLGIAQTHLLNFVLGYNLNTDFYIISKIYMHKSTIEAGFGERTAGVYILMIYAKILFNFFLRYYENIISKQSDYFQIFLNLHFYGCLSYLILSDLHIVAARVSELLCLVEIFLVPYLVYIFKPRLFGKAMILGISFFQLIITLYIVQLSSPYRFGF
ncbi:EpsG family protein [Pedobacter hiemivivus]|uniref:EpsG family protein n=1 Tax=Pedobacter hiemivivus TaxID=2530454 RepID=UPI0013F157A5|nr:EpsG family protein [Pedobacter hiemivivus]